MQATLDQLAQLSLFAGVSRKALADLQPHTQLQIYQPKDIIFHEGDPLPVQLHILLRGALQVQKHSALGKKTILRSLIAGDFFAAAALFDQTHSLTTVFVTERCQVLTIPKAALLETIQKTPELALQFLGMLNQRLQQQHSTIHGLVSERAVVRLAQLIQESALQHGTDSVAAGAQLRSKLPYAQIARSIGIAYEECARLMKRLAATVQYSRGGKIIILDRAGLAAIASGEVSPEATGYGEKHS